MSELRQDRTSGTWVIIAPNRARRSRVGSTSSPQASSTPEKIASCPFCPGNESELPEILVETPQVEAPGWSIRIVPNKFAAVGPNAAYLSDHRQTARPARGQHEVIIESPRHNAELSGMVPSQVEVVVTSYRDRATYLLDKPEVRAVVLFRNFGMESGASLPHPHAQIIAIDFVPMRVQALADWGAQYFDRMRHCPTCFEIENEVENRERIIEETDRYLVMVPFAAAHPCEMWVVPKGHQASFCQVQGKDIEELARLIRRSLQRLKKAHQNPAYNFVIDSASKPELDAPYVHWRLRIMPNLTKWGGFEMGTGVPINPSSPEADAALLRSS